MKKNVFAVVALVGALGLGLVVPQAASAYPSGSNLQVSAIKDPFKYRSYTRIAVANAIPNENLQITLLETGKLVKYFPHKADNAGNVNFLFWPFRPGKFTLKVVSGSQTKSVVVYSVTKPIYKKRISVRRAVSVHIGYVTPGTVVSFTLNGTPVTGIAPEVADANGDVTFIVPALTINRGANDFRLSVGSHFVSGGMIIGLR